MDKTVEDLYLECANRLNSYRASLFNLGICDVSANSDISEERHE